MEVAQFHPEVLLQEPKIEFLLVIREVVHPLQRNEAVVHEGLNNSF